MPDANEGGAGGAPVSMQLFEVHGEPMIHDSGTTGTDSTRWRTFDSTRATTDDYVTGQSFLSLGIARGGTLPATIGSHDYLQWRLHGEAAIRLKPGRSYAFLFITTTLPHHDRSMTIGSSKLSNSDTAANGSAGWTGSAVVKAPSLGALVSVEPSSRIFQIEIWDPWDHYVDHQSLGGWSKHPFNPLNNVNYTPSAHEAATDFGLGLSPRAQATIASMREIANAFDVFQAAPRNDLLGDREPNEAYCLANPGRQYAVYFPNGGSVNLDVSASQGSLQVRWLDIDRTRWHEPQTVSPNNTLRLKAPGQGHWAAVIQRITSPSP